MSSQVRIPGNDCLQQGKKGGSSTGGHTSKPLIKSSREKQGKPVVSVRRLSTISEHDPDKVGLDSPGETSEWSGSSFSLCSDSKYRNGSGHFSSMDSYQPDSGDDCAAILLTCLYCRFYELVVMLPDTCERAVSRCFPAYKYAKASSQSDQWDGDCCSCDLELNCGACNPCQETAEFLELAMEVSEICFH